MIAVRNLEKRYPTPQGEITVLHSVSFTVEPEASVAIVGPSGSGKTTLLGLMAGLDLPSSGEVRLLDQDIFSLTEEERARFRANHIGFVFQTFHLLSSLTALENVRVPLELAEPGDTNLLSRREGDEWARELLERVGLGSRMKHYPSQLSGGEQQRVALARAFANRPRILFADEPTGNLDRETGSQVVALLEELNRAAQTTLVLVTHDLALAERADSRIHLDGGRVQPVLGRVAAR